MEKKSVPFVPAQKKGGHTGAQHSVKATNRKEALQIFEDARKRLLNINRWQNICGSGSAEFRLTDKNGQTLNFVKPRIGNLIRIKLPAPKNQSGKGFDWVRIEAFKHTKDQLNDEEQYGFRVRPVQNPFEKDGESAHFYTSDASSTFLISRKGRILTAKEFGRNEIPNSNPQSLLNKIRNIIIAVAAMAGFAKPQWKKLMKGILEGNS
ncbi:MAG: hypothetical protein K0R26_2443 [Bacteroidota bacterium]|jgi:hypothetical protein|nr:hypothetical protein [Bacteroidota bacterium]